MRFLVKDKNLGKEQDNMIARKTKRSTTTRVTRNDAEASRAIKLRKLAKNIGVVSARFGRTRSATKRQVGLSKIQSLAKLRHRRSLMKHISLLKVDNAVRMSQLHGTEKHYVFEFKPLSVSSDSVTDYQNLGWIIGGDDDLEYTLVEQIRRLFIQNGFKQGEGLTYKVAVFGSDYEEGTNQKEVIGTTYFSRPTDL